MSLKSTRGITRLKYKSTADGWLARYTRDGVTFSKTFSDSTYGGPESSKEAAAEWHKEVRSLFPPMSREEFFRKTGTQPESGIRGVRRHIQINKGFKYPVWTARWTLNGKMHVRTFSINKYGEEEAKRRAIEARQAVEQELEKEWQENYWNYRPHTISDKGFVEDPFAYEGQKKFVLHLTAERDRSLRSQKIDQFLADHGRLVCEVCGFSFEEKYGELGRGLIEIHHLIPMADLSEARKTILSELMCICSNCHFTLHNGDPTENLRRLRIIFDKVTISSKKKDQPDGVSNECSATLRTHT